MERNENDILKEHKEKMEKGKRLGSYSVAFLISSAIFIIIYLGLSISFGGSTARFISGILLFQSVIFIFKAPSTYDKAPNPISGSLFLISLLVLMWPILKNGFINLFING